MMMMISKVFAIIRFILTEMHTQTPKVDSDLHFKAVVVVVSFS